MGSSSSDGSTADSSKKIGEIKTESLVSRFHEPKYFGSGGPIGDLSNGRGDSSMTPRVSPLQVHQAHS